MSWPCGLSGTHDTRQCAVCSREEVAQRQTYHFQVETGTGLLTTRPCKFCGELLFYRNGNVREIDGWCCGPKGKWFRALNNYRPSLFSSAPTAFLQLWRDPRFAAHSRMYQQMNCFSSMGTSSAGGIGFEQYLPGGLCLSGRTFHCMRNAGPDTPGSKGNPLRWLLYDPDSRQRHSESLHGGVLKPALIKKCVRLVNEYNR